MLGTAVGAALAACLSVRFGRKRSLLFSAALFVVGSLVLRHFCAATWSPIALPRAPRPGRRRRTSPLRNR